ncbi:MAG: glycerophosphodiester phosphodiesterase, partial [Clostridia bacterium]|nr:glycerophosphodiester phosphodiesterase [Clostridia bacterium]
KDKIPFNVVQLPANQFKVIRCGTERFIRYCHSLGIAVQYWTIDEIDEIKRLSDIGADCIITDVPDKMYKLFNH